MTARPGGDHPLDAEPEASAVRPYTVTGGRTRPSSAAVLPYEALVEATGPVEACRLPEARRILAAADREYLSIAELSAQLHLPIGVVRVLVGDLLDAGLIRVHASDRACDRAGVDHRDETLRVLERVLDGIASR